MDCKLFNAPDPVMQISNRPMSILIHLKTRIFFVNDRNGEVRKVTKKNAKLSSVHRYIILCKSPRHHAECIIYFSGGEYRVLSRREIRSFRHGF